MRPQCRPACPRRPLTKMHWEWRLPIQFAESPADRRGSDGRAIFRSCYTEVPHSAEANPGTTDRTRHQGTAAPTRGLTNRNPSRAVQNRACHSQDSVVGKTGLRDGQREVFTLNQGPFVHRADDVPCDSTGMMSTFPFGLTPKNLSCKARKVPFKTSQTERTQIRHHIT